MVPDAIRQRPFCANVQFATGDTTKTIQAAPGVGNRLVITTIYVLITTSAAQLIKIGNSGGTINGMVLAASTAIGSYIGPFLEKGFPLADNEALIYNPAAAGPAGSVIAEGWIEKTALP